MNTTIPYVHVCYICIQPFRWFKVDWIFFLLSWTCLLPDLTTWVTHRVSYAKQKQLTFREYLCSSTVVVLVRSVMLMFLVFYDMCVFYFFFSFVFVLMCPMLPVSLHFLFVIALWFSLPFIYHDNSMIRRILGWSDDRHLYISSFYILL